jgi:hypothetical protein
MQNLQADNHSLQSQTGLYRCKIDSLEKLHYEKQQLTTTCKQLPAKHDLQGQSLECRLQRQELKNSYLYQMAELTDSFHQEFTTQQGTIQRLSAENTTLRERADLYRHKLNIRNGMILSLLSALTALHVKAKRTAATQSRRRRRSTHNFMSRKCWKCRCAVE